MKQSVIKAAKWIGVALVQGTVAAILAYGCVFFMDALGCPLNPQSAGIAMVLGTMYWARVLDDHFGECRCQRHKREAFP